MNNYILPNYNRIDLNFIHGNGAWLYTKNEKYLDFQFRNSSKLFRTC